MSSLRSLQEQTPTWKILFDSFNNRVQTSVIATREYNSTENQIIQLFEAIFSLDFYSKEAGVGGIVASFLDKDVFRYKLKVTTFEDGESIFPILSLPQLETIQNSIRRQMIQAHARVLMFFKDEAEGYLSAASTLSPEKMQRYSGRYLFQEILPNSQLLENIQALLSNSSNSLESEDLSPDNQRQIELEELENRLKWISEDEAENRLVATTNKELAIVASNLFRLMEILYKFNIPFEHSTFSHEIKPYDYYERYPFSQKFIPIFQALKEIPNQDYFNPIYFSIFSNTRNERWFSRNLENDKRLYALMMKNCIDQNILLIKQRYQFGTPERIIQSIFLALRARPLFYSLKNLIHFKNLFNMVSIFLTQKNILRKKSLFPHINILQIFIKILVKEINFFIEIAPETEKGANKVTTKQNLLFEIRVFKSYSKDARLNDNEFSKFFPRISMDVNDPEKRILSLDNEAEGPFTDENGIIDSPDIPRKRKTSEFYFPQITIEEIFEEFPTSWPRPIEASPLTLAIEEEGTSPTNSRQGESIPERNLPRTQEESSSTTNRPEITERNHERRINRRAPNRGSINWINPANWFIWVLNLFCCSIKYV